MKCRRCSEDAVFANPAYCKKHFISYVENKILKTIKKYDMIKGRIIVAVSGGKDSLTCLHVLSKHYPVEALAVDEGIAGYREHTIKDLKRFCKDRSIKLRIASIKKDFGFTLDAALKRTKEKPCTVCGAIRRYLINKYARKLKAKRLATGHNLDDEAQSVLMNFFRNQLDISARLGPVTGLIKDKRFVPRIKPLYFVTEKEVTAYSMLMDFGVSYVQCPYAGESYRGHVQELLNEKEKEAPGTKQNIIKSFLKMLPDLKKRFMTNDRPNACSACGEPSHRDVCKVCEIVNQIKNF